MNFYKTKKKIKNLREQSIEYLGDIKWCLNFYDVDLHYARKWEKLKTKKHSLRKWLVYHLNYNFYDGEPPTVEECHEYYKEILNSYHSVLNEKYYTVDIINNLLDFLNRKKANDIDEAVALYEIKKNKRRI